MNIYQKLGEVAERPHLHLPAGTYEEEIGLDGFYGPASHLYHYHPPTQWKSIAASRFQWAHREEAVPDFLRPQCYKKAPEDLSGDFFRSARLLFWNDELSISIHRITDSSSIYFRNADASELYFCHDGSATLDSVLGCLEISSGDYLVIPKGVTYRWKASNAYLLRIESYGSWYKKPETGILGRQALYHEEGIHSPKFTPKISSDSSSVVRVQKDLKLTEITYGFDIRNLSGWCGDLYPYILPTKNIAPVLSSVAHLPPSINSTFIANGFIVCTFLPRPLEEPPGALKVPFFHSNIDYDEFIFYHAGDFFSRDNMGTGYITMHPRGINHGPHPKALSSQGKKTRTDETAVMIDTIKPLRISKWMSEMEMKDYWKSWSA